MWISAQISVRQKARSSPEGGAVVSYVIFLLSDTCQTPIQDFLSSHCEGKTFHTESMRRRSTRYNVLAVWISNTVDMLAIYYISKAPHRSSLWNFADLSWSCSSILIELERTIGLRALDCLLSLTAMLIYKYPVVMALLKALPAAHRLQEIDVYILWQKWSCGRESDWLVWVQMFFCWIGLDKKTGVFVNH